MQASRKIILLAATGLCLVSCVTSPGTDRKTRDLLEELDRYLSMREIYVARKVNQCEAYRGLIQATPDPARRFELGMIVNSKVKFPHHFT